MKQEYLSYLFKEYEKEMVEAAGLSYKANKARLSRLGIEIRQAMIELEKQLNVRGYNYD
ncbi:TPA: hypothetical protein U2B88_000489 [Streptococcus suis]|nr:hypothetical protein [Streptococcus suis]NQM30274.1 hypothetical protein [Streptococcus suis]NRG68238.1 hypothetical protein [Streptococcus suis]HEM5998259.1 hypothetical protein [Streptococcus suis]HEM6088485.1 hypothetical protein [Streptococcus suis]